MDRVVIVGQIAHETNIDLLAVIERVKVHLMRIVKNNFGIVIIFLLEVKIIEIHKVKIKDLIEDAPIEKIMIEDKEDNRRQIGLANISKRIEEY